LIELIEEKKNKKQTTTVTPEGKPGLGYESNLLDASKKEKSPTKTQIQDKKENYKSIKEKGYQIKLSSSVSGYKKRKHNYKWTANYK